jgi:polyisoprenoid-binding protein YceI
MAARTRSRLPLVIGALVVGLLVVGGVLYASGALDFLKDTSDPELVLSDAETGTGKAVDTATLDGTWAVVPGKGDDATVAGYRVREVFAAGAREVTANGRTGDVTGSLTVADGAVTEAAIAVDLTTLSSDQGRRDNAIKERGLQTNAFPEGTFRLTEPIELPDLADGKTFTATAVGDLTLHGVTNTVTIDLEGRSSGGTFTVQGAAPVVFADYGIDAPSVGGFVEVQDTGSFEFLVNFEQA